MAEIRDVNIQKTASFRKKFRAVGEFFAYETVKPMGLGKERGATFFFGLS